jgi:tetratricopeptide (TPR) repeat protein
MTVYLDALAQSHNNLGELSEARGDLDEALASFDKAGDLRERAALQSTSVAPYRYILTLSSNNVGLIRRRLGRTAEALAAFEQAREIGERLVREIPETAPYRQQLVLSLEKLVEIHESLGHPLDWLRAELAAWSRALTSGPEEGKMVVAALRHWKEDFEVDRLLATSNHP